MKIFLSLVALLAAVVTIGAAPIPVGPEYDTLADLLVHQPIPTVTAKSYTLKGRDTIGDGGGGDFFWFNGDTTATNRGTVFAWGNGRLMRQFTGSMDLKWFGAKGNLQHDDTDAIQDALDTAYSDIWMAPGGYVTTRPVRMNADRQNLRGAGVGESYFQFTPSGPGSCFIVGRTGGNSTVFPSVQDIGFRTDASNPHAKVALELYDCRFGYFNRLQTGPKWTGPSTNNVGIWVRGRDQTHVYNSVFQADVPRIIDKNPESFVDFDLFTFENCSFLAESGNICTYIPPHDVMISNSHLINESWNKVGGFQWIDPGLTRRSFNLSISHGRMEQTNPNTNGWCIDIQLGTLDLLGSGGNVLQGLYVDRFDTDGFQNGIRLRGVVGGVIRNVGFFQYRPAQFQLDIDSTDDWISTWDCFSQQGGSVSVVGLRNVKQSPYILGNTPMARENLWVRDGASFRQWQFSDMMIKGGLGVGVDDMPVNSPIPGKGAVWGVMHDNTTNTAYPFLAMRLRDQRTNVFRGTGIGFAEFESSFPNAPVWNGVIEVGPQASTDNWFTDLNIFLNTSLTQAANDPTNLTKVVHIDGKDQYFGIGPGYPAKTYFDGRILGTTETLRFQNDTTNAANALQMIRDVAGTSSSPRSTRLLFGEGYSGPIAYTGMIETTRLNSSLNYFSEIALWISSVFSAGTPTPESLTKIVSITGGPTNFFSVTADVQINGTLRANSIDIEEMNVNEISVTNSITAGTFVEGNSMRLRTLITTPTAAAVGAGGSQLWSSNAVLYVTYSADGLAATTKLLAP